MKKVIWLIILVLSVTSCKEVTEVEVANQNDLVEVNDTSIEEIKDSMTFGTSTWDEYSIELVMLEGSHIIDNSVGAIEYTGEYWQGKCQLELSRNDEMIDSIEMNNIFEGILSFKDTFSIETFEEEGITYFLIGQYFSSNLNDYKLFKVVDDKIIYCKELGSINISGKPKYSCLLDDMGDGRYKYQFYDNSIGEEVNRILVFEEGTVKRDI